MTLSAGVLYSCRTLLDIVHDGGLHTKNFSESFIRIEVADAEVVLSTAQKCNWLRIEGDGAIRLTERGTHLRGMGAGKECLREQLFDVLVSEPPPWSRQMIWGRFEALKIMPLEAKQCFEACELTKGTDDDVVLWWERTSNSVRSERAKVMNEIGRKAEKYSLNYERRRTGAEPIWQAVETSVAGFDVLSVTEPNSEAKLKIEVKGSSMRKSEASFFVTRNEWNTARKSKDYHFHLWLVREAPLLFVVPSNHVEPHIPSNQGGGLWDRAELFFRDFAEFEVTEAA